MGKSPCIFAMASEWMANGNINEFIKANLDADRFELVGIFLLSAGPETDPPPPPIAQRRYQRIDLSA